MTGTGGALRALMLEAQTVIGCPEWCTWAISHPSHEHVVVAGAEIVTTTPISGKGPEEVLEVRHLAAPLDSGPKTL